MKPSSLSQINFNYCHYYSSHWIQIYISSALHASIANKVLTELQAIHSTSAINMKHANSKVYCYPSPYCKIVYLFSPIFRKKKAKQVSNKPTKQLSGNFHSYLLPCFLFMMQFLRLGFSHCHSYSYLWFYANGPRNRFQENAIQ